MATDMTTDVQQWWAGLLAYLGDQASALGPAGITSLRYGTTVRLGLMKRGRYWRYGCWMKATLLHASDT